MAVAVIAGASAATPTGNIPIGQMPIAPVLKTNAWFPIIQPDTGKTTNDNFRVSTLTLVQALLSTNAPGGTTYVTNTFTTNLVINGWQLIISNGIPNVLPVSTNALYVDPQVSEAWVWDPTGLTWLAINPSYASGSYALPTVVDLRLVHDNGLLQWATTRGNLVATDGQGRMYWWDASATDADDGIAVIDLDEHLAGEAGRWLEQ